MRRGGGGGGVLGGSGGPTVLEYLKSQGVFEMPAATWPFALLAQVCVCVCVSGGE